MDPKFIKEGMRVKIDEVCEKTTKTHHVVPGMKRYLGTVQSVTYVSSYAVDIQGFSWHPDDISIPKDSFIKIKPELFNLENIC